MVRKGGLGRGLDAMISGTAINPKAPVKKTNVGTESKTETNKETKAKKETSVSKEAETAKKTAEKKAMEEKQGETVFTVKMTQIEPNRKQPRKQFDEDALLELAESIKQFGVLQPLLVQKKGDYYEIIAGERRWRASKLAGVKEVPVIIKNFSEQEAVEISLIENIQRENLNPIEEAAAYKRLMEEFHLKQDMIAERVSKSRTAVTNSMRLLKLDERVQQMLIDEMLSTGHARALLAIENNDEQHTAAVRVFDEKLSVRETEKLVKELLNPKPKKEEKPKDTAQDLVYEQLEEKIKGIIGSKVAIHRKSNDKGRIEIEYYSQDELERIVELLESVR